MSALTQHEASESAKAASRINRFRPGRWRKLLREMWANRVLYLILAPFFAGLILFQYYPAFNAFFRSFYAWDGRKAYYIGLSNYGYFLSDPKLLQAWANVAQLLVFNLVTVLTIPVVVAYFLYRLRNQTHRFVYRVLFVLPLIVPGFVSVVLWRWILSMDGVVNYILGLVGLEQWVRVWFGDSDTALYAIMAMGFPFVPPITMLIYLAGFLSIPSEIVDAAVVDGATGLKRLWKVELPMIQGQLKLFIIFTFIGTIQNFGSQLFITQGGPGWATMVPGLRMYYALTKEFQYGYASAIGVVLFIIIFLLTLINQKYISSGEEAV